MKVNEFQAAWAESVGIVVVEDRGVALRYEGKTLGEGRTVLDAVLDAFVTRRKTAETLQAQLGILMGLGKDPETVLAAIDEVFPTEEEEETEDDDSEEAPEVRVVRK